MKETKPSGWMKRRDRMCAARDEYLAFLSVDGPDLIEAAKRGGSLRDLSKRSGLSASYLSLVKTGQKRLSPRAYAVLAQIAG